jgi:hypothetical protein
MYTNAMLYSKCTEIHCYSEYVEKDMAVRKFWTNKFHRCSEKVQKCTVHKLYTKYICSGSVHKHSVVEQVQIHCTTTRLKAWM